MTEAGHIGPPVPDILGEPWVARTIALGRLRDGGEVTSAPDVATLVHRSDAGSAPRAVLYLPGFVDYFFQKHHADKWVEAGYDFYALDLRRSGRSINGHPRPHDVRDLRVFAEEIDAALAVARGEGRPVVLLAHSTGGLAGILWANDHPGAVDVVVLNSPWLDLNDNWFRRVPFTWVVDKLGPIRPAMRAGGIRANYGQFIHAGTGGEWDYDLALKPHTGFPATMGFGRAVRRAQAEVGREVTVREPVLLACSSRTGDCRSPGPADLSSSDVVLDVRQMIDRAPRIGPDVTILQVPGGVHDLALSPEPARTYYTRSVIEWVGSRLG